MVVLTSWDQVRQTQARQLQSGNAAPNAQMQAMTKVFPVIFGLITLGINAGATMYFVVSNAWRIGQQHLVIGKMYDQAIAAGDLKPKDSAKAPPDIEVKDSGNGAKAKGKPGASRPPAAKAPPASAKGQNGKGSANGAGQGMTSGARRKKKRKR